MTCNTLTVLNWRHHWWWPVGESESVVHHWLVPWNGWNISWTHTREQTERMKGEQFSDRHWRGASTAAPSHTHTHSSETHTHTDSIFSLLRHGHFFFVIFSVCPPLLPQLLPSFLRRHTEIVQLQNKTIKIKKKKKKKTNQQLSVWLTDTANERAALHSRR